MSLDLKCYKYKEYKYDSGLLDESVDVTYIIHLEGNGRLSSVLEQINKYKPTKLIYIVFNKGFKKCKKQNFIKETGGDLIDANFQIFKHAKLQNYNNILILEDDFFFDDKILNKKTLNIINNFLNKHKNKSLIYSLGCIPFISIPYDLYHFYSYKIATHACIFTKSYREKILLKNQEKIVDWDRFNPFCFIYHEPLCYQIFAATENQYNWDNKRDKSLSGYGLKLLVKILISYLKLLKLDKSHKNFDIAYNLSKLSFILIIIIIIKKIL